MSDYNREKLIAKGICEVCTIEKAVATVTVAVEASSWAEGMGACIDCLPQVCPKTEDYY